MKTRRNFFELKKKNFGENKLFNQHSPNRSLKDENVKKMKRGISVIPFHFLR
jgi:hypothetical protein